jgi:putative transposase
LILNLDPPVQAWGVELPVVCGQGMSAGLFANTLKKYKLRQSVGRTGICYDNAMAESFFAALKNERVHRTQYPTRGHARRDIIRYIEFWFNSRRRHSGLGYRSTTST